MKRSIDFSTSRIRHNPDASGPRPCPISGPARTATASTGRSGATGRQLAEEIERRERAEARARHLLDVSAHALRAHSLGDKTLALAHEVKRPLGVIVQYSRGGLRHLASGKSDPALLREILESVLQQAEHAIGIVQSLRGFTARRPHERGAVEVAELLGQVLELARAQTGPRKVVFRSVIGAALPAVEADPIQIQQVVLNLLHNAVEAVQDLEPERQRVTLRAAIEAGGDGVEITVSDLGPGCPPDVLPHIFEPHVTTKPDSLGLGLAISRSIVEAHGGKLWAVPNSADGLSFHFSLPARKDQQHEFAGAVPQLPVRHASDGLRHRR